MRALKGETHYERLKNLMTRLRNECPWDSQQTFESISKYTIEEAYEVADAIEQGDKQALKEELGDLLFQVIFYAKMAEEEGEDGFNLDDVIETLVSKMVRRHPHVFGDQTVGSVPENWEKLKEDERKEKGQTSVLDGVALGLPALMRAEKLQKRAAKVGFDWPNLDGVWDKLNEEISEVKQAIETGSESHIEEEIGDVLFSVVNLARKLKIDPEVALRNTNAKFTGRFMSVEDQADGDVKSFSLEELEAFWQKAKTL